MLWIILIILLILIGLFGLVILIRKAQSVYIGNNLMKLSEAIEGSVRRAGFADRPFFQGKYNGHDLVVNFSAMREGARAKEYYVTFSYDINLPFNFSVMSKAWLETHPVEENPDVENLEIGPLRVSSVNKNALQYFRMNQGVVDDLGNIGGFVYFFASVRGLMFEVQVENHVTGSDPELIQDILVKVTRFVSKLGTGKIK